MKIVNRAAFLAMPAGTVFQKYSPCVFGDIEIKGDTLTTDFYATSAGGTCIDFNDTGDLFDKCDAMEKRGASCAVDFDTVQRDGLFDLDQLFAVWDRADVEMLVNRLAESLRDGYGATSVDIQIGYPGFVFGSLDSIEIVFASGDLEPSPQTTEGMKNKMELGQHE
jgi:hypothetical protein